METKRSCAASMALMMLSLFLAVAMAARVVPDHDHGAADADAMIRLHTDGKGDVRLGGRAGNKQRPYDCCDAEICSTAYVPRCACPDWVESCSSACNKCHKITDDLYTCNDWYQYGWEEERVPKCYNY